MILMRADPFRVPLEGVGPENQDFFGLGVNLAKLAVKKLDGAGTGVVLFVHLYHLLFYNQLVLRIRY